MKAPLSAIPVAFGCVLAFAQPPAEQPAPQIQRAVHWRAAGVTTFELAGGINLHVRAAPRPGAGKVMIAAFVPGLELDETNADRGTAMLAAEALTPAQGEVRLRASLRPEGLLLTATCPAEKAPAALSQIAATRAAAVIDDTTFAEASGRLAAPFARQSERP
ncbi:MAG: hypothetical protein K2X91_17085, partial [Thermoleophilia bacterium]|nr:hypothetical protein [Thermoleophilia bacterium]